MCCDRSLHVGYSFCAGFNASSRSCNLCSLLSRSRPHASVGPRIRAGFEGVLLEPILVGRGASCLNASVEGCPRARGCGHRRSRAIRRLRVAKSRIFFRRLLRRWAVFRSERFIGKYVIGVGGCRVDRRGGARFNGGRLPLFRGSIVDAEAYPRAIVLERHGPGSFQEERLSTVDGVDRNVGCDVFCIRLCWGI